MSGFFRHAVFKATRNLRTFGKVRVDLLEKRVIKRQLFTFALDRNGALNVLCKIPLFLLCQILAVHLFQESVLPRNVVREHFTHKGAGIYGNLAIHNTIERVLAQVRNVHTLLNDGFVRAQTILCQLFAREFRVSEQLCRVNRRAASLRKIAKRRIHAHIGRRISVRFLQHNRRHRVNAVALCKIESVMPICHIQRAVKALMQNQRL